MEKLPVRWYENKKAWMNSVIFNDWLKHVNKQMKYQGRKNLLFIDNESSHEVLELSNVEVKFLPANTTFTLQPLDHGIIRALKTRYRKFLLRHIACKINEWN